MKPTRFTPFTQSISLIFLVERLRQDDNLSRIASGDREAAIVLDKLSS